MPERLSGYSEEMAPASPELTFERETNLSAIAHWWGDRIVATGEELLDSDTGFPEAKKLVSKYSFIYHKPYYTLLAHHTYSQKRKEGIRSLGAVLGIPGTNPTLHVGQEASIEILAALGIKGYPYGGKVKDGLLHVYLAPVPDELEETCRIANMDNGSFAFASAFGNPSQMTPSVAKSMLINKLSVPWMTPFVRITENPVEVRKILQADNKILFDRMINLKDDKFVYRLRSIDNKYLIGII